MNFADRKRSVAERLVESFEDKSKTQLEVWETQETIETINIVCQVTSEEKPKFVHGMERIEFESRNETPTMMTTSSNEIVSSILRILETNEGEQEDEEDQKDPKEENFVLNDEIQ